MWPESATTEGQGTTYEETQDLVPRVRTVVMTLKHPLSVSNLPGFPSQ